MMPEQEAPKKPETPIEEARLDFAYYVKEDPYRDERLRKELERLKSDMAAMRARADEIETDLAKRDLSRQIKAAAIATINWKAVEKEVGLKA